MQEENFIVRETLLDTQERVLGYALSWQQTASPDGRQTDDEARALARSVADQLSEAGSETLPAKHWLFLEATPALLADEAFCALAPKGTVLALPGADLSAADAATVQTAHAGGYGIALRDTDLATIDKSLLAHITHIEIAVGANDFAAQVQLWQALNLPSPRMVVHGIEDWQTYDACAAQGLHAQVGNLPLMRRSDSISRDMNPAQAMILQLMDMVRKNADVKQLESVLKRDAALSYKLLRYINSAGFGLGCEIQSLRHAVTLLGYSPLYRWLALLLATATTSGYSPVLMQTAVIRGRFAELLGQAFLPRSEAENLFVAGMFSLLDRLLGVPMEDVLEKIQLSDAVTQALLSREGIYGPFLALAEACEMNSEHVESMATSLCIGARQVNQAHLSALFWAQNLTL